MTAMTSTELSERLEGMHGVGAFLVLVDNTGRVLNARTVNSRFGGQVWLLDEDEVKTFGRRFIPLDDSDTTFDGHGKPGRSKVQKDLGLRQAWQLDRARVVKTWGGEYGPWVARQDFVDGLNNTGVYTWNPNWDHIVNPEMVPGDLEFETVEDLEKYRKAWDEFTSKGTK